MKETEVAEGVAPKAETPKAEVALAAPAPQPASAPAPRFTVDEHSQRFKSTWNAAEEQVSLGHGSYAKVFREYDKQKGIFVAYKCPKDEGTCMEQEIAIMEKLRNGCENLMQLIGVVVASHDAGNKPIGLLMECCHQSLNEHGSVRWVS